MTNKNYKVKAIILKRYNVFEADRIVTAFTFELGKIRLIAKGVRRTTSKLAGSIELFSNSNLNLSKGKNLDILTSAVINKNYFNTYDLKKIKLASYIAEIVDKTSLENQENKDLFELIDEVLSNIDKDEKKVKIYFLTNYIYLLGILPQINICVKCNVKPLTNIFISSIAGGILDENCAKYFEDSVNININTIKFLNFCLQNKLMKVLKINLPDNELNEIIIILNNQLKTVIHKELKSEQI